MTTTENTVAATTVARKYAPEQAVSLFAAMLQGTAVVLGTTGPAVQDMLAKSFDAVGIDAYAAIREYAYLTRR